MKKKRKTKKERLTPEEANRRNQKMCLRKRIFWNEMGAQIKARNLSENTKSKWYSYKCPNCLQWHLSKVKEKESDLPDQHQDSIPIQDETLSVPV